MSTKIEWVKNQDGTQGTTWNPVTGCSKCSPGCLNCYAERMHRRLQAMGQAKYAQDFNAVVCHPEALEEPLKWKKPRMVFVCSMGDLFHEDVTVGGLTLVFDIMSQAEQHTFQVLTKRPELMRQFLAGKYDRGNGHTWRYMAEGAYLPNVWIGVTVCNQEEANIKIPILLEIPAAVRFVSIEPMLGPVDISPWLTGMEQYLKDATKLVEKWDCMGEPYVDVEPDVEVDVRECNRLDWVICGGETGPGARPMHPDWVRSLRDQCTAAGVPCFFKAWGEYVTEEQAPEDIVLPSTSFYPQGWNMKRGNDVYRVGKKRAGHLLDGQEWRQMPEVQRG